MRRRFWTLALLSGGLTGCTVEQPGQALPPPPTVASPPAPSDTSSPLPERVEAPAPAKAPTKGAQASSPPPLLAAKPAGKVDVEAVLLRANRAFESGNLPNAVRAYEEVLLSEPKNRRALSALGQAAQRLAMDIGRPQSSPLYLKSAEAFRKLREVDPNLNAEEATLLPFVLYNEACTLAITGESTRALTVLNEAFDTGFPRIDMLDTDTDLDSIRRLPAFLELQRKQETRHVENLLTTSPTFPFDFTLPDLEGKPRALSELRGKVTIVDIWGTWCLPCRKEIPHLNDLARRYQQKGLKVVGLNYEKEEDEKDKEAVRAFVKEYQIDYPCLFGDQPTLDLIPEFQGYPTTLFLGPDGKVKMRLSGYQSLMALETAVQRLLGEGEGEGQPATKAAEPKAN